MNFFYILISILLVLNSCGPSQELMDQMKRQDDQILDLTLKLNKQTQKADSLSMKSIVLQTRIEEYQKGRDRINIFAERFRNVRVKFKTTHGSIELEFYPNMAPFHVLNFVRLAEGGFYNGVLFHRTIENFMIQSGDPNTKNKHADRSTFGEGQSVASIPGEMEQIHHDRGVLSMAREGHDLHSGSSQFFIVHQPAPHLDGKYSVFGKVVSGMDVVDKIAKGKHLKKGEKGFNPNNPHFPKNPARILKTEVYLNNEKTNE